MYIRGLPGEYGAMAKHIFLLSLIVVAFASSIRAQRFWTDPYDVVWTTPSKDAAGSMPLGNGEVGINLWVEENGDLNFYISRSDSFSEISRLLKVGQSAWRSRPIHLSPAQSSNSGCICMMESAKSARARARRRSH